MLVLTPGTVFMGRLLVVLGDNSWMEFQQLWKLPRRRCRNWVFARSAATATNPNARLQTESMFCP